MYSHHLPSSSWFSRYRWTTILLRALPNLQSLHLYTPQASFPTLHRKNTTSWRVTVAKCRIFLPFESSALCQFWPLSDLPSSKTLPCRWYWCHNLDFCLNKLGITWICDGAFSFWVFEVSLSIVHGRVVGGAKLPFSLTLEWLIVLGRKMTVDSIDLWLFVRRARWIVAGLFFEVLLRSWLLLVVEMVKSVAVLFVIFQIHHAWIVFML